MTPHEEPGAAPPGLLAIGETMAMVTPFDAGRFGDATRFRLDAGGAESNVAAHVAALGHRAAWFSRLGDDPLGHRIAAQVRARGVDVSAVVFDAARPTGVYVKFPGQGVQYYRAGSAAAALSPTDADAISFGGARVLHVSGITAAISPTAAAFLQRVIVRARESDVLVSVDANHRAALWDADIAAVPIADLLSQADIAFVGRDEAQVLWGTATADDIRARFDTVPELVVKDSDVGATTYRASHAVFVPSPVVDVVDVVGAGDAFAGGYLAAVLDDADVRDRLAAGHIRAALTLGITGDSIDEGVLR